MCGVPPGVFAPASTYGFYYLFPPLSLTLASPACTIDTVIVRILVLLLLATGAFAGPFVRGDVNADGTVGVADLVFLTRALNSPGFVEQWPCADAADIDDDGAVTPADATALIQRFLAAAAPRLPAPFPAPGEDPTEDALRCAAPLPDRRDGERPHEGGSDLEYIHFACRDAEVRPGATIRIPIVVRTVRPLAGTSFALQFDSKTFTDVVFTPDAVQREVASGESWINLARTAEGRLGATFLFGRVFPAPCGGAMWTFISLGTLTAVISPDAVPGASTAIHFRDLSLPDAPGYTWVDNQAADARGFAFDLERRALPVTVTIAGSAPFVRGDADDNAQIDPADAIALLRFLFARGLPPRCPDAVDINDDGRVDIGDPLCLLRFLWARGRYPAAPFPAAGQDPTEDRLPPCSD